LTHLDGWFVIERDVVGSGCSVVAPVPLRLLTAGERERAVGWTEIDQGIGMAMQTDPATVPPLEDLGGAKHPGLRLLAAAHTGDVAFDLYDGDDVAADDRLDDLAAALATLEEVCCTLLAACKLARPAEQSTEGSEDRHVVVLVHVHGITESELAVDPGLSAGVELQEQIGELIVGDSHDTHLSVRRPRW
jgi:hypothetical protein